MNKYLIYIVAIDSEQSQFKNSDYAQYSIASWKKWCEKNGVDLVVRTEPDGRFRFPIWAKESVYEYGKGYDMIGVVDSDTMIDLNAPNLFLELNPESFYGVNDLCDLNWLFSSIEARQKFFPDHVMDIFKYLNAGVLFFGKKHLEIFERFLNFVLENQDEINEIKGGGKEQTLLNFFLQTNNVDVQLLTPRWNLLSIHRKNMFTNNWQLHPTQHVDVNNPNTFPHFLRHANIWHFTGFPVEERARLMSVVWDIQKQNSKP